MGKQWSCRVLRPYVSVVTLQVKRCRILDHVVDLLGFLLVSRYMLMGGVPQCLLAEPPGHADW